MRKIILTVLFISLILAFLLARRASTPATNPPVNAVEVAPSAVPSSQVSPDGKFTVSTLQEGIFVNDSLVVNRTNLPAGTLSPVFNSWSPNNKYFFVLSQNEADRDYLVFKADGSAIRPDKTYLSINEYFAKQLPDYQIDDVTGWASPFLVVVNAQEKVGENKISLWFDLTTLRFIRLSSYFE